MPKQASERPGDRVRVIELEEFCMAELVGGYAFSRLGRFDVLVDEQRYLVRDGDGACLSLPR